MKNATASVSTSRKARNHRTLIAAVTMIWMAQPAWAGDQVPFRASFDTVFEASVSIFPVLDVEVTGEGQARHLGRTRIETISETINLLTGVGEAIFVFTAANGDTIELEADFLAPPTPTGGFLLIGSWMVSGGTGRFANASGSGCFEGWAEPTTDPTTQPISGVGHFTMTGTISKPRRN